MPDLVDTHCHIQSAGRDVGERGTSELWAKAPQLTADAIIESAHAKGVTKLICVGCDLEDSKLAVEFAHNHEGCWATIGIHPHEAKEYVGQDAQLKSFAGLIDEPKVVAVGECGLDYYYGHSPKADQENILRFQIELALKHDLPMIFHVREAFNDFWPIFEDYKNIRGVVHSFTDTTDNMQKALNHGLYIGVNGIATFAKSPDQLAVYSSIPLDRLLLETDAPFLTPTPHRGSINEPKHISVIAEFLAKIRSEDSETVMGATTANAERLFGGLQ